MFSFYLPFSDKFLEILTQHEINHWEAKHFWEKFETHTLTNKDYFRQQMYGGLKILTKKGYLKHQVSKNNPRMFLYSKTEKAQKLQNINNNNRVKNIIKKEINTLNNDLLKLMKQKTLIENLLQKYPFDSESISKVLEKLDLEKNHKEADLNLFKNIDKIL